MVQMTLMAGGCAQCIGVWVLVEEERGVAEISEPDVDDEETEMGKLKMKGIEGKEMSPG
jgi:hypothetical protein